MKIQLEDLLTDISFRRFVLNPNQDDSERWNHLIKSNQIETDRVDEARELILSFYEPLSSEEFESEAIEFRRRINVTPSEKKDIISLYEQRRPKRFQWMKYAAAITFLVISVFAILVTTRFISFNESNRIAEASELIVKETERGQKKTIFFPDGTNVKLNSESKITYPVEFSTEKRIVTLEGEAYFEVAHHDDWPFIVKTKNVNTEVIGTSFNVNNYEENDCVTVALVEGSVKVNAPLRSITLDPMEMITISEVETALEVTDFDYIKIAGWKDNVISFDKASFEEVEATLERWFDVDFVYEDKLVFEGGYKLTLENGDLKSVLEGISSNKFEYRIEGKKVYIY